MSPEEIARAEKALAENDRQADENDRQADENARFLKLKPEIMDLLRRTIRREVDTRSGRAFVAQIRRTLDQIEGR